MSKIRFQILPPIDRSDEAVFVTGSIPALGDWQPEKSLRLSWKPPYHLGDIEAGTRFEYKDARYRTLAEPTARVLGGSSLGGLISFYIAIHHPGFFGNFACVNRP